MARTRKTEKAVPKQAEIISINTLRAQRDAGRANRFLTIGIVEHEPMVGEISVCRMTDGTYMLAYVEAEADGLWYVRSRRAAEVEAVGGRVVFVDVVTRDLTGDAG
jgi:pimeloyl-CoA synthetase